MRWGIFFLSSEESLEKSAFDFFIHIWSWFLEAEYLEDTEDTDHDKSILVSVMWRHEVCDLATEVHDEDE